MTNQLATRVELVREAWLILAEMAPIPARMLYMQEVEGMAQEEIAETFECGTKRVRQKINGFTHTENDRFYNGAKQWLEMILVLLAAADDADVLPEVLMLFDDASGRLLWGTRFPNAAFSLADAAREAGVLPAVARLLAEARRTSRPLTEDLWGRLLTMDDEDRLTSFFDRLRNLPADEDLLSRGRALLEEMVPG